MISIVSVATFACSNAGSDGKAAFERGNSLFDAGKFDAAVIEYRSAVKADDKFGLARFKLSQSYLRLGYGDQALQEGVRAADLLPENNEVQLEAAGLLLAAGKFEDARTRAQKVIARDPSSVDAQLVIGNALAGLKDFDGAVTEIEQAIKIDPSRAESYANLAALRAGRGETELAKETFARAVEKNPKSLRAWLAQGNFLLQAGDLAGAEAAMKRAFSIDDRNPLANRALVLFYRSTGRAKDAEPHLKKLADVSPGVQPKLDLADYYIEQKRLPEAQALLTGLVKGAELRSAVRLRLASIEYLNNRQSEAHGMLDGLLKEQPNYTDAALTKVRWLVEEKRYKDALAVATAAAATNPQSVEAHFLLGTLRFEARDIDGAIGSFTEVLRLNPRITAAQVQLSRLQLMKGDATAASQLATLALKAAPEDRDVRLLVARSLLAQGDTAGAQREFGPLQRAYPDAAVVHAFEGELLVARKDLPGARAAYERALKVQPSLYVGLEGLSNVLAAQGKVKEARALLEGRVTAGQPSVALLVLAARARAQDKDLVGAEKLLRQAIAEDANVGEAYSLLGQIYVQQGRLEEARKEYEAQVRLNPKNSAARILVAEILQMQQKPAEARKMYEQALDADPKAAIAANNLAYFDAEAGTNLDVAFNRAQMAKAARPDDPDVNDTLGWVYVKRGLPALAVPPLQEAIQKSPSNPVYHYHLGIAHLKANDKDRARTFLQRALQLSTSFDGAADAQRELTALTR